MEEKTNKVDKDVIIQADPANDCTYVEANSAEGMLFCNKTIGSAAVSGDKKTKVEANEIPDILNGLREKELTFSFKLKK